MAGAIRYATLAPQILKGRAPELSADSAIIFRVGRPKGPPERSDVSAMLLRRNNTATMLYVYKHVDRQRDVLEALRLVGRILSALTKR